MKKLNKNVLMILAVAVLLIVGIIGMTIIKSENTKQQETEVVTQELEDTKQEEDSIAEDVKENDEEVADESKEATDEETDDEEDAEEKSVDDEEEDKDTEQSSSKAENASASKTNEKTSSSSTKETTKSDDTKNTTDKKTVTTTPTATPKPTTTPKPTATPTPTATPKPTATPTPTPEPKKTCTITIRCDTILNNMGNLTPGKEGLVPSNGVLLGTTTVEFTDGQTVFDVLTKVCANAGLQIEYAYTPAYGSYYIEGINNLYEFDCGPESGWMYKVNGWFPNYGCSSYTLSDGDSIVWCYTCNGLGADVGA